jgi:DNA-binding protein HU-beta
MSGLPSVTRDPACSEQPRAKRHHAAEGTGAGRIVRRERNRATVQAQSHKSPRRIEATCDAFENSTHLPRGINGHQTGNKGSSRVSTHEGSCRAWKVEFVTLKSVFEQIGESHDLAKKQAHQLAADLVEVLTAHLVKGDKVRISGFGILEVKNRPARKGRNPGTGEPIEIAASKTIAFRPAKELKQAV